MKKKIVALLFILVLAMTLAGCGKFICGFCREEKRGKKHILKPLGVTQILCDDCYKKYFE